MERALILSGGGGRGAFQVGVLKYLEESTWRPDLISGTSVGAINAAGIGSGLSSGQLAQIWKTFERKRIYRISMTKLIRLLLGRGKFKPPGDTAPLRSLLEAHMDVAAIRQNKTKIIITAVNMTTAQLAYFDNRQITLAHLMASSAFPLVFPWQNINGEPYWDGGIMDNTPVLPALQRGVKEIIIVLLSPVGAFRMPLPGGPLKAAEMLFEQSLISVYRSIVWAASSPSGASGSMSESSGENAVIGPAAGSARIKTVAPERMLGFKSLLSFSGARSRQLMDYGYQCARRQL